VRPPAQALEGHAAGRAISEGGGSLKGGGKWVALGQARDDFLSEPVAWPNSGA
jgi:hypothetical protein